MKADTLVVPQRTAQQRDIEDQKDTVYRREAGMLFAVVPCNRTQQCQEDDSRERQVCRYGVVDLAQ